MKTSAFASITLAAFLTALSSIEVSIAQAKQQCSAAMPSSPQGHWWSYRLIDGRKCWYEGKPGLSKSLLEWPADAPTRPVSGEKVTNTVPDVTNTVPETTRNPLNSQAWAPPLQPPLQTPAPNLQAPAPSDSDSFEARWPAKTGEEAASVTDAKPATPEVDDGPSLKKADKLQSPYADSVQPKVTRTLVIVPDQPLPVSTGLSRHTGRSPPTRSIRASPSARE
jgi:hypothetical protein